MSGKGKGKKGKDMGGKDNARKFASKREQTELARSLPSGSDLCKKYVGLKNKMAERETE